MVGGGKRWGKPREELWRTGFGPNPQVRCSLAHSLQTYHRG